MHLFTFEEKKPPWDLVGDWSLVKLEILQKYAAAYSRILSAQRNPEFHHIYIDAFAGGGMHITRTTGELIWGSARNALEVQPPFREYHFIDLDAAKTASLKLVSTPVGETLPENIYIYTGDSNEILLRVIVPKIHYELRERALCVIDPYGLHLEWKILQAIADTKAIEIFYNFSVYDANLNVLLRNPDAADPAQQARMTAIWGDQTWRDIAYRPGLFGIPLKEPIPVIARAFQTRLREIAGFEHVADPLPVRNSNDVTIYYLYFASHKPVAKKIVDDIFKKYRPRAS